MYLRLNADSISTKFIAGKLNEALQNSNLNGSIGNVIFNPGAGFEIKNLRISRRGVGKEILSVAHIVVTMPTGAKELAQLEFEPTLVELHRAEIHLDHSELSLDALRQLLAGVNWERDASKPIPIRIRDSQVVLQDGKSTVTRFSNVALDVTPVVSGNQYTVQALASGEHLKRIAVTAKFDLDSKQFDVTGFQARGTFDKSLVSALPVDLRLQGKPIIGPSTDLSGSWQVTGKAMGTFNDLSKSQFGVNVAVSDFNLVDDQLPATIRNCQCQLQITDRSINVQRATGQLDGGKFDVSYTQSGLMDRSDWLLTGGCHEISYSKKWLNLFPESIQRFCRDYDPSGQFDVQFRLDSKGDKQVTAQLRDTSFSYYRFPYRLSKCIGDVKWIGNRLRYQVKTLENGQLLEIGGHIDNPGEFATYVCNFGTDGMLPIDEPLLRSMTNFPAIDRAVRDFRPHGRVSGQGTIEKLTPGANGKVQKRMTIHLHDCDVRHRSFDYPIQNVDGTIQIFDESFRFENMTGVSSSGRVECNGDWNSKDGLRLVFLCNGVPFDSRLRHALNPSLQTVWDSLQPSGRIRLGKVFLNYLAGTGVPDIRVEAKLGGFDDGQVSDVSITPTWFPYEISRLSGVFEVGEGVITMRDVRGKHGRTWVNCAGSGTYNEQQWNVRLANLLAGSVSLDDQLMKALPPELASAIESLKFEGHFNVSGDLTFGADYEWCDVSQPRNKYAARPENHPTQPCNSKIDWNLRFDMDQASMVVGLPIENIFGSLFLNGTFNGHIAKTAGRVAFDSATIYGAQITNIAGPIWIDNKQSLAGKFAENGDQQPASITGTAFEGKVNFDGWMSHEKSYPFFVQATVEDSQLEDAAAEIAPHMGEMAGDAYGFVRLRGNAEELHTYKGVGNVHLRNARIHELPVILALLKILQIKEVNRTAFDSSDVNFSISGDQIELSRIELIGDAISLIGNGYLEWMRYADVNFYSVVGRNRFHIPVLSDLYKAGCQRTLWINVGGPIDNLQTSRKVLPGLNDSIKALFQSTSQTAGATHSNDTLRR